MMDAIAITTGPRRQPAAAPKALALGLLATVLAVGVMERVSDLVMVAGDQRPTGLLGETWWVCVRNIVALSMGASAGAVAAYGLLFCPELSPSVRRPRRHSNGPSR